MASNDDKRFTAQIRANAATYITAAFGLVAGLAWNEAITALIEKVFPISTSTIIAKFIYALALTILLVLATVLLMRFLRNLE